MTQPSCRAQTLERMPGSLGGEAHESVRWGSAVYCVAVELVNKSYIAKPRVGDGEGYKDWGMQSSS